MKPGLPQEYPRNDKQIKWYNKEKHYLETKLEQLERFKYLIKTFNWHSPSWDLFIILAWVVVSVIYSFAAGRGRALAILISIYISKLLLIQVPHINNFVEGKLQGKSVEYSALITFVALFLVIFLFLSHYVFKTAAESKAISGIAVVLGFSVLQVGLLISTVLTLVPTVVTTNLSPLIHFLFLGEGIKIFWLVTPILYLIVVGKMLSEGTDT